MMQDNASEAKSEGPPQAKAAPTPAARPPVNAPVKKAEKPAVKAAVKPAVRQAVRIAVKPAPKRPAKRTLPKAAAKALAKKVLATKVVSSAAGTAVKALAKKRPAKKQAVKAPAKGQTGKAVKAPPKPDKRLPGIRAAAGELSRALDAVEKARSAIEESFGRTAAGNLARAQGALHTLSRMAESVPLLDVRNLERELARLVEDVGDLKDGEGKGRKRDMLALDEFLGDAAARLELAVTPAARAPLKLLSERLPGLEAIRRKHQSAVHDRFLARLVSSRRTLSALSESCGRLDKRALGGVSRELESALGLCKTLPVGKLQGKPRDLYGIDCLVKQLDRRLARVQDLLADRKEQPDG